MIFVYGQNGLRIRKCKKFLIFVLTMHYKLRYNVGVMKIFRRLNIKAEIWETFRGIPHIMQQINIM